MRYFENPNDSNKVYGYDPVTQTSPIDAAISGGWVEVTGNWPPAMTLAQVQQSQTLVIQSAATNAETAPLSFTTAGAVTAMFSMDQNSWTKYLGAYTHYVVHGQALPTGFAFYSDTGTSVPFTLTDITNFFTLGLAQIETALDKQATLLTQIATSTTVAQVTAVVW